jgi:hypothetical protein
MTASWFCYRERLTVHLSGHELLAVILSLEYSALGIPASSQALRSTLIEGIYCITGLATLLIGPLEFSSTPLIWWIMAYSVPLSAPSACVVAYHNLLLPAQPSAIMILELSACSQECLSFLMLDVMERHNPADCELSGAQWESCERRADSQVLAAVTRFLSLIL